MHEMRPFEFMSKFKVVSEYSATCLVDVPLTTPAPYIDQVV